MRYKGRITPLKLKQETQHVLLCLRRENRCTYCWQKGSKTTDSNSSFKLVCYLLLCAYLWELAGGQHIDGYIGRGQRRNLGRQFFLYILGMELRLSALYSKRVYPQAILPSHITNKAQKSVQLSGKRNLVLRCSPWPCMGLVQTHTARGQDASVPPLTRSCFSPGKSREVTQPTLLDPWHLTRNLGCPPQ